MCIAIYKPAEAQFPYKRTLERCFEANPDGAGFMYAAEHLVTIKKGFSTFRAFWKALRAAREETGDGAPYVLHFRISTQAGIRPDCTHPFPLSRKMDDLRKLSTTARIGVAHNGIIRLTSSGWSRTITYSDTMEFITKYAALLIRSREWYKDADLRAVIERLADSRLAILDGEGHCELLGAGWIEDGGVWYSNASYKPAPPKPAYSYGGFRAYDWGEWYDERDPYEALTRKALPATDETPCEDGGDPYADLLNEAGLYEFDDLTCPATTEGDATFCASCASYAACYGFTK